VQTPRSFQPENVIKTAPWPPHHSRCQVLYHRAAGGPRLAPFPRGDLALDWRRRDSRNADDTGYLLSRSMVRIERDVPAAPSCASMPWSGRALDDGGLLHHPRTFRAQYHLRPAAHRFNAGQKLIYWVVVRDGGAAAVSGYVLIFPFYGTTIETMQQTEMSTVSIRIRNQPPACEQHVFSIHHLDRIHDYLPVASASLRSMSCITSRNGSRQRATPSSCPITRAIQTVLIQPSIRLPTRTGKAREPVRGQISPPCRKPWPRRRVAAISRETWAASRAEASCGSLDRASRASNGSRSPFGTKEM
jgi:hypothetical protein